MMFFSDNERQIAIAFILRGEWAVLVQLRHVMVSVVHVIPTCGC